MLQSIKIDDQTIQTTDTETVVTITIYKLKDIQQQVVDLQSQQTVYMNSFNARMAFLNNILIEFQKLGVQPPSK